MTFEQAAKKVRQALEDDKRTLVQIGEAAELHPVNLSQFKNNSRDLSLNALIRLARALGLEINIAVSEHKAAAR
jgi:hypothetical protein